MSRFKEYEVRVTPPGGGAVITIVPAGMAREPVVMVIPKAVSGTYRVAVSGRTGQGGLRQLEEAEIAVP